MQYFIVIFISFYIPGFLSNHTDKIAFMNRQNEGIELCISNIKNKSGMIRIGMYNSAKGYPDHPEVSFSLAKDTLNSGIMRLFIPVKEPGSFGFSILDDENGNGKMDYILGIIPKEGFGFSNNPGIRGMKAPSFDETRFTYGGGKKVVTVRMIYI